jgi:hypothetical protein
MVINLTGRLFGPGRARAVPRAWVAGQARPGPSGRAGPGRARWPPGRAVLGSGQNAGPWAGPPGLGLHGQVYS